MSNKISRPIMLLALLAYSSGCSDDSPSAPDPQGTDGALQFNYAGSGFEGHFIADGVFQRESNGNVRQSSFATAVAVNQPQYQLAYYEIIAAHFYLPEFDDIGILLSGQAIGEYPVASFEECGTTIDLALTVDCSAISFDLHFTMEGNYPVEAVSFELVDGIVTVTSVTDGRLKGVFNGIARQLDAWSAGESYLPEIEVVVTGGTFDVPIITLDKWMGNAQINPEVFSALRLPGVH